MVGDIIAYVIFGFLVGVIARFALPGRRHLGCMATILAGIAGS
ncbi:MAG: GlsB/YeaQ/YmgE family stress response membrane protein, partial [Acidimicrobiia bacterium]|nr:GlsB/YeaQ/YmgE family stress response membrane protein [Acidimicrobiia bacterium]